ncbi:MAG TPA: LOG family protein [Gemmatimonadales bacterium]|jgi:hypothetical protein|nr:LOG family protein [Gemmatimonadales bacterium]
MPLRRVAVLGGTNSNAPAEQGEAASVVGRLLAEQGIRLLHGDRLVGPAAALVTAFRSAGGIAGSLDLTDYAEGADGFLVLPGGPLGVKELFARYLDRPAADEAPCGLLNTLEYFTGLLKATDDDLVERFVRETQRGRLIVDRDPIQLLRAMLDFRPPETRRERG